MVCQIISEASSRRSQWATDGRHTVFAILLSLQAAVGKPGIRLYLSLGNSIPRTKVTVELIHACVFDVS